MTALRRRRWSLRTRLVVSAVMLIAVVATVIGTVTTIAFRSYLYDQMDRQVEALSSRTAGPPPGVIRDGGLVQGQTQGQSGGGLVGPGIPATGVPQATDALKILTGGGAPLGTVGAEVDDDGTLSHTIKSTQQDTDGFGQITAGRLNTAQTAALSSVARDNRPHTVTLPGLGDYRARYVSGGNGDFLVGLPLSGLQSSLNILVIVEVCVTAAGLVAAGITGVVLVGMAMRPLRRVAMTATRVSELPLHSGEVAPLERVPDAEADPRTEVGQVGAALNRMLGHVGSALTIRQESETRVRRFVADAGHELRTPLASIRGYAELTRRGREEVGPDTRHALGRIESEAKRMTGLVEDLLLLARLDAGRPLAYEDTQVAPLVVNAVSDARAAGPDHAWCLELPGPEEDAATVYGDASRLHQVLVNLLANARTHTPPGTTVTARVNVVPVVRPGGPVAPDVVLEVEDDGPGIAAALLPHVFERFARGDASRSRAAGSTGLGLAIVRAVVTAHGGSVGVRSVPGRTVFAVRLPARYDRCAGEGGGGVDDGPVGDEIQGAESQGDESRGGRGAYGGAPGARVTGAVEASQSGSREAGLLGPRQG